jgi:DNA-directed RNA polymerase subunit N (RpoN/RPB10)
MSAAAHSAPAMTCRRSRNELDALLKRVDHDKFRHFFFTRDSDVVPDTTKPSGLPRCVQCGCAIEEHWSEQAATCRRTRNDLDALLKLLGQDKFRRCFFTSDSDVVPGTTKPSGLPRCVECGCTVNEHRPEQAAATTDPWFSCMGCYYYCTDTGLEYVTTQPRGRQLRASGGPSQRVASSAHSRQPLFASFRWPPDALRLSTDLEKKCQ